MTICWAVQADEEIDSDDVPHVVLREALPTLRGWLRVTDHVLGDGGLGQFDPDLAQLADNVRRNPERIGTRHTPDEFSDCLGNRRPPGLPERESLVQYSRNFRLCRAMTIQFPRLATCFVGNGTIELFIILIRSHRHVESTRNLLEPFINGYRVPERGTAFAVWLPQRLPWRERVLLIDAEWLIARANHPGRGA